MLISEKVRRNPALSGTKYQYWSTFQKIKALFIYLQKPDGSAF